jgi:predicted aspartyl protease
MRFARILFSRLAVAAIALIASSAFAGDNCGLKQIASIPAQLTPDNRILLDATIEDGPVKIQLDSGAAISVISQSFVKRAGLETETARIPFYGLTNRGTNQETHIHSMRLGNGISANAQFYVSPVGGDGTTSEPVGFFGDDYLQNYDIEVDLAGGKVNLFSQDHCAGELVHWAKEYFKSEIYFADAGPYHRPMTDVVVDGVKLHGLLDTGAASTTMRMAVAQSRFGLAPTSSGMEKIQDAIGIDGHTIDNYRYSFKSMTFGDITLHNPNMMISPIDSGPHDAALGSHIHSSTLNIEDVLLGMSLLRQMHFAISYSEHALYYTIATQRQAAPQ